MNNTDQQRRIRAATEGSPERKPEQKLAAALLERIVLDATGAADTRVRKDAIDCLNCTGKYHNQRFQTQYCFSIIRICEILDFDLPSLRNAMKVFLKKGPRVEATASWPFEISDRLRGTDEMEFRKARLAHQREKQRIRYAARKAAA
jgi:hypothetical protein